MDGDLLYGGLPGARHDIPSVTRFAAMAGDLTPEDYISITSHARDVPLLVDAVDARWVTDRTLALGVGVTAAPESKHGRPLLRRLAVAVDVAQVPPPPHGPGGWRAAAAVPDHLGGRLPEPVQKATRDAAYLLVSPQRVRLFHDGRLLGPFVCSLERTRDPETLQRIYKENTGDTYRIPFLVRTDLHLIGTDVLGRVSLSVGLLGVAIQRIIEFLISIPTLPPWMGLTAALPPKWPALRVYFGITIILSILGWTGLARVVRGKLLELRSGDFVVAARVSGATSGAVIRRHLLQSFLSYLIVHLTLAVPNMILGETALSFIGLGLEPPVVSWGVLLTTAQNFRTVALSPWLMIPVLFVVATVMTFMFLGDGLRDAADPYK